MKVLIYNEQTLLNLELNSIAGANFLDTNEPGWRKRIKRGELKMGDPGRCIGGQLRGGYTAFLKYHGLSDGNGKAIGLNVPDGVGAEYFYPLTEFWLQRLDESPNLETGEEVNPISLSAGSCDGQLTTVR